MNINDLLLDVQQKYFERYGIRVDVHYKENKGALLVREGDALIPQNVIASIPDYVFSFGNFMNINFD